MKQYMRYRYRKETAVDDEMLREHVANINDDFVTCDRYGMMGEPVMGVGSIASGLEGSWG